MFIVYYVVNCYWLIMLSHGTSISISLDYKQFFFFFFNRSFTGTPANSKVVSWKLTKQGIMIMDLLESDTPSNLKPLSW